MSKNEKWQFELEEYTRIGEQDKSAKSKAWKVGIGLQAVDGLTTSEYLLDVAKEHIEGYVSIEEARKKIESYYEKHNERTKEEVECEEADIVSVRIAQMLSDDSFQFSPAQWINIHKTLFKDILKGAGKIRDYNISKKEWVLKGASVIYAPYTGIEDTLDYDFQTEKKFVYRGLSLDEVVKHISKFTSDIWQIHPFCEGNTRATAVFIIKYLRSFGFEINNDMFEKYSWYFRNALVRANYTDIKNNIYVENKYLEMFFSNLIAGGEYELKNRYMHVDYKD